MENINYGRELNCPPSYESRSYERLKEEVEFPNSSGQTIQSTVVTIVPDSPPIRDHIIWSLFNTVYMNFCCLGLLAFVFSVKSRDRKLHGDKHGALSYASTARSLNIASTVLSILFIVIGIIIFIVQMVNLAQSIQQQQQYNHVDLNGRYGK
ncbi:interferon-induced transmembrane protein 1-like [Dendropsophus ebraccatus]|uniref:interferon-induced transmembrane protein 1-like n=1 Tax=Dendropsophus ebraccatus TaxID=150705 RepID=UPI003831C97F